MIDVNREYSRNDQLNGLPNLTELTREGYDHAVEDAELSHVLHALEARRLAEVAFDERMKPWATTAAILAVMGSIYAIVLVLS